ncbi:MAG TPA: histidinol-phosphatase [Hyphomicrobium sp.]|nr:histidinol-phosphatase [Hyphomicrobium sp.]
MKSIAFKTLLEGAHAFADLSGPAVLKWFRRPIAVHNKVDGGFDPVTAADRAAEKAIAKALKVRFPDHALTGEEFGDLDGMGRYRWIVDPIDGTRAFIMGSPLWGTLIGLMDGDQPLLGLMDQPFTGERFWSSEKRAHLRRGPGGKVSTLRTRACANLAEAVLTSTHPGLFAKGRQQQLLGQFEKTVRMTRYGGDCYSYCLLAAGYVDLIIEPDLKTYDIAPLIPIIERAGGVVTTWSGEAAGAGGDIIASGDKRVHEAALKLLAK